MNLKTSKRLAERYGNISLKNMLPDNAESGYGPSCVQEDWKGTLFAANLADSYWSEWHFLKCDSAEEAFEHFIHVIGSEHDGDLTKEEIVRVENGECISEILPGYTMAESGRIFYSETMVMEEVIGLTMLGCQI